MTFLELLRQSEAIFSGITLPQGWKLSLEEGSEKIQVVVSDGVIRLYVGEVEKRDYWPTPSEASYAIASRNLDHLINGPNGATFKMLLQDRIVASKGDTIVRRARMERDAEAEELIRQQKLRDDAARAALEALREQQEREAEEERAREAERQKQIAAQRAAEEAEKQRKAFEQEKKLKDAIKKPAEATDTAKGNSMNVKDEILYGKPLVSLEGTQDDVGGRDFPPEAFDHFPTPPLLDDPSKPLPVDTAGPASGTTETVSLGPLVVLGLVAGVIAWAIWG